MYLGNGYQILFQFGQRRLISTDHTLQMFHPLVQLLIGPCQSQFHQSQVPQLGMPLSESSSGRPWAGVTNACNKLLQVELLCFQLQELSLRVHQQGRKHTTEGGSLMRQIRHRKPSHVYHLVPESQKEKWVIITLCTPTQLS